MREHSIDLLNLVLPVYHEFFKDNSYFSILYGGRGSGKSRAIAQKIVFRCLSESNHLWVVLRETKGSHTDSTYRELREVINQFGVFEITEFYSSPSKIKFPSVNSEILFLGMDDEQHLKSLSGVTGLWWEEISQIKSQEKFEEVLAGFRPDKGHYEQVLMSFNPVSKEHWIKKRFFDFNPDTSRTYIKRTTYLNNPFLNKNTVGTYLNLKYTNEFLYRVNVLGEWGTIPSGNEFYKNFSYAQYVDSNNQAVYNPNLLHPPEMRFSSSFLS